MKIDTNIGLHDLTNIQEIKNYSELKEKVRLINCETDGWVATRVDKAVHKIRGELKIFMQDKSKANPAARVIFTMNEEDGTIELLIDEAQTSKKNDIVIQQRLMQYLQCPDNDPTIDFRDRIVYVSDIYLPQEAEITGEHSEITGEHSSRRRMKHMPSFVIILILLIVLSVILFPVLLFTGPIIAIMINKLWKLRNQACNVK